MMEIQKLLVLVAVSWMCCDAVDEKGRLLGHLMSHYEKDAEPPLSDGVTNTTVSMSLQLLCATPFDDFIMIEGWLRMVSTP